MSNGPTFRNVRRCWGVSVTSLYSAIFPPRLSRDDNHCFHIKHNARRFDHTYDGLVGTRREFLRYNDYVTTIIMSFLHQYPCNRPTINQFFNNNNNSREHTRIIHMYNTRCESNVVSRGHTFGHTSIRRFVRRAPTTDRCRFWPERRVSRGHTFAAYRSHNTRLCAIKSCEILDLRAEVSPTQYTAAAPDVKTERFTRVTSPRILFITEPSSMQISYRI